MLRGVESNGIYHDQGTTIVVNPEPFIPGLDQMALFGKEFLPPSHQPVAEKPENLELGLEIAEKKERKIQQGSFESHYLSDLNTVVQQRKIYEDIDVLAANIEEERLLIHPLFVVRYTSEDAAHAYLVAAYGTVGKKVPLEHRKRIPDLVQSTHDGKPAWYIVIAGHRRLRALEMLEEPDSMVQVFENMDPFRALKVQVSENTSKLPKDFERAEQNGDLWMVDKATDPNLTIDQFAKRIGHRPEIVRRDLLYYGLPDEIKNMVVPRGQVDTGHGNTQVAEQPLMPFRVAAQLGRLVERGVPKDDVLFLAKNFWEESLSSEESARKRVNNYLKAYDQGAIDMESLFGFNAEETARLRRNQQVGQRFVKPTDSAIQFFERVAAAKKYGMSTDIDGVSYALAARKLRNLAAVMDRLLPEMKSNITSANRSKIKQTLTEMERTARKYGGLLQQVDADLENEERQERELVGGKEVTV